MSTVETKRGSAATARSNAIRKLVDAHPDEFDALQRQERVALGLPETPVTRETKEQKIAKLEAKIAALQAA